MEEERITLTLGARCKQVDCRPHREKLAEQAREEKERRRGESTWWLMGEGGEGGRTRSGDESDILNRSANPALQGPCF